MFTPFWRGQSREGGGNALNLRFAWTTVNKFFNESIVFQRAEREALGDGREFFAALEFVGTEGA